MKKSPIIDMEQRGGVFVPREITPWSNRKTPRGKPRPVKDFSEKNIVQGQPQQIGKILEGMITDFFRVIRREMFR